MKQDGFLKIWQSIYEYTSSHKDDSSITVSLDVKEYKNNINNVAYAYVSQCIEYIAKALSEKRQYINEIGEVVDINKVRKVSKSSVTHLAKNSNLLKENDDELYPEKLYVTSKNTDYAVYENKLLYTLLYNLKNYVNEEILKLEDTSDKKDYVLTINSVNDDTLSFTLQGFSKGKSKPKYDLAMFHELLEEIDILLENPLLKESAELVEISKSKTSTNIIKMDNHFSQALQLYTEIMDDRIHMVEVEYGTTQYVNDENELQSSFDFIMNLIKETVNGVITDFEAFKNKITKYVNEQRIDYLTQLDGALSGEPIYELLSKERQIYKNISQENEKNTLKISALNKKNTELTKLNEILNIKLNVANQNFDKSLNVIKEQSDEEIANITKAYEKKLKSVKEESEASIQQVRDEYDASYQEKIDNLTQSYEEQISSLTENLNKLQEQNHDLLVDIGEANIKKQGQINKFAKIEEEYNNRIFNIENEYNKKIQILNEQIDELVTKNKALSISLGIKDDTDYTTKEEFDKLEAQYHSFKKFYEEKWRETKKSIKKRVKESDI